MKSAINITLRRVVAFNMATVMKPSVSDYKLKRCAHYQFNACRDSAARRKLPSH